MTKQYRVIINAQSGSSGKTDVISSIRDSFKEHGVEAQIIEIPPNADINQMLQSVVGDEHSGNDVIVAAGGDGTINAIAQICLDRNLTLGIIPLGTFNYFARNYKIPLSIPEAVKSILDSYTVKATVGKIGKIYFLNNASLGLYKKIIENREDDKSIFGRFRLVAFFSAMRTVLSHQKLQYATLRTDEAFIKRKTSLVFIGVNAFQLKNLGMPLAKCVEEKLLGISIMRDMNFTSLFRLLIKSVVKRLEKEESLEQLCSETLVIELNKKTCPIVIDGEIVNCPVPLEIKVCPDILHLLVPHQHAGN